MGIFFGSTDLQRREAKIALFYMQSSKANVVEMCPGFPV
jgi:hypothetical protein